MAMRSRGRKLSFDVLGATAIDSFDGDDFESLLYRSNFDSLTPQNGSASESKRSRRKRRNKGSKKKRTVECSICEDSVLDCPKNGELENGSCRGELEVNCKNYSVLNDVCEEVTVPEESGGSLCTLRPVKEAEFQNVQNLEGSLLGELRQRNVAGGGGGGSEEAEWPTNENATEESGDREVDLDKQRAEPNGDVIGKLGKAESLDWKWLMARDPNRE